ncbi:helix-turn-helix domain-containing protein [Clostridiaceae bacterium HSG29]|nr:helix-turn-helix domain-containing protein [Clostridiaceae bacterium HSG29]
MILADKIIKLRKQFGWTQEDLAEKMNISRQSVSKWESANSIPDLNKIIRLADIFGVSTDYLLKDKIEEIEILNTDIELDIVTITLDDANKYVRDKIEMSNNAAIGSVLSIGSVIPLLFLIALSKGENSSITTAIATAIGLGALFVLISIGVKFFLQSTQYESNFRKFEEDYFELDYGVRAIFKEKAENFKSVYTSRVSLSISLILISVVPMITVSIFDGSSKLIVLMLVLLISIVGISVYILIPTVMVNNAYNCIISEGEYSTKRKFETKRIEKFAAFYWPLITAIYIGWSLWTMRWHVTWIIWPVAGIAFGAFAGLIIFLASNKK